MNKLILCVMLIVAGLPLSGQNAGKSDDRISREITAVRNDIADWDYKSAIKKTTVLTKRYPDRGDIWMLHAGVLIEAGKTVEAEQALKRLIEVDSTGFPEAFRWISERFFKRGNYPEARDYYDRYLKFRSPGEVSHGDSLLFESIRFALEQMSKANDSLPKKLSGNVNSTADEYFPNMTADGKTLVFTRLIRKNPGRPDSLRQEDLYRSQWDGNTFSYPESFAPPVGSPGNEGAQTIRQDGRIMIFTACHRPDSKGGCDLYQAVKSGGDWSVPVNLGYPMNTRYWESTPSLSFDGRYLYFSSNRPGGYGGMDIWRSVKLRSGGWSEPVNLGKIINTTGDEMTPVCTSDPALLFFASNGHPGMGGFDLFRSRQLPGGSWGKPENLGYPVNTHADEDGLAISALKPEALIASDRDSLTGKDLYWVSWQEKGREEAGYVLEGRVMDSVSRAPLSGVIEIHSVTDTLFGRVESDPVSGFFQITLLQGPAFILKVTASGYLPVSQLTGMMLDSLTGLMHQDILMRPVAAGAVVVLQNIYFKTDSYELLPGSSPDLESMFEFIVSNPDFRFEIRGHTDSTGDPEHNAVLSRRRAESVRNYLINRGISGSKLIATGLGSTEPIADNATEEGRKQNRRTELKILRKD